MDTKFEILEAWTAVEQFSEGDININSGNYKKLEKEIIPVFILRDEEKDFKLDWERFFKSEIDNFLNSKKIDLKSIDKTGISIYFNIFQLNDVISLLRKKYNLLPTEEELIKENSTKFSLKISFNHELEFIPNKLFYSLPGKILEIEDLPHSIFTYEKELKDQLISDFKNKGFSLTFEKLFDNYSNTENYFIVQEDLNSSREMHSFFIKDLMTARNSNSVNLDKYLGMNYVKRVNLCTKKEEPEFNRKNFESFLNPDNYPFGSFPSDPKHTLALMQQVALNIFFNEEESLMSVNGPPGTGKTALLKDIFAEICVKQAKLMEHELESQILVKNNDPGEVPDKIAALNILVASSNNGAVQNIVNELPLLSKVDSCFLEKIKKADYFFKTANYISDSNIKNSMNSQLTDSSQEKQEIYWGLFSLEGGRSDNMEILYNKIENVIEELNFWNPDENEILAEFRSLYNKVSSLKNEAQEYSKINYNINKLKTRLNRTFNSLKKFKKQEETLKREESELKIKLNNNRSKKIEFENQMIGLIDQNKKLEQQMILSENNIFEIKTNKPKNGLFNKIFGNKKENEYNKSLNEAKDIHRKIEAMHNDINKNQASLSIAIKEITKAIEKDEDNKKNFWKEYNDKFNKESNRHKNLEREIEKKELLREEYRKKYNLLNFNISYEKLHKSNPWFNTDFKILQTELFISSLKVRKYFLWKHKDSLRTAVEVFRNSWKYPENSRKSFEWINLAIPVIGSTFASLGNILKYCNSNSLGSLFIDEAGQATPQAAVGAIMRYKKILALGDPSQIKPVLTLDSKMMRLIAEKNNISDKFLSSNTSVQSLIDNASKYGLEKKNKFYVNNDTVEMSVNQSKTIYTSEAETGENNQNINNWIGIPLWVHRRCANPMFLISNSISYDDMMVQGKSEKSSTGKAFWFDISGKAENKYVDEQGDKLLQLISQKIKDNPLMKEKIYVISPFKNVANKLAKKLEKINSPINKDNNPNDKIIEIGTVHTFQGKETNIVYFVLGADINSRGSAEWVVSEPNLINVAVTRAKEEFYIIGDKELYKKTKSPYIIEMIKIIDNHNN